ncbi:MAG: PRC-barrel domain containing protein [Burkholderiales bacterium]|nr:MAG: PRC-barrel domain containing protein [Burkholderiales bacterium]
MRMSNDTAAFRAAWISASAGCSGRGSQAAKPAAKTIQISRLWRPDIGPPETSRKLRRDANQKEPQPVRAVSDPIEPGLEPAVTFSKSQKAWGAVVTAAILATGGMTMGGPDGPVRMSGLKVSDLSGYEVIDMSGARVGHVSRIETDGDGRTRWLNIGLDAGGEARVASFRADLDAHQKLVSLRLSEDLLIARAETPAIQAISSPSV